MSFSLTTERLILDDLTSQDRTDLNRLARDRNVMQYVLVWLDTDEQIAAFLQDAVNEAGKADRLNYTLAARIPTTGTFAGLTFIEIDPEQVSTAEVGCVLLPEFWGIGYGPEVLSCLLKFGFETLGMHRVYGKCDELNLPSCRVLERGGLKYEGTIREHVWLRDHWRSTRYYGMLAEEYALLKR